MSNYLKKEDINYFKIEIKKEFDKENILSLSKKDLTNIYIENITKMIVNKVVIQPLIKNIILKGE